MRQHKQFRYACTMVGVGFVTWVALAARGPRGTDQYWYVGDIDVEHATGERVTNHIYPFAVSGASVGRLPVRMHDLPMTDIATLVSTTGVSSYASWVALNVASLIAAALLVLAAARVIVGPKRSERAWLAPLIFLSLPASTWFAVNALVEATIALGVALCLAGWAWWHSGRSWGLLVQAAGACVLLLHRENFVLVALASIAATLWAARRRDRGWAAASVAAVLSAWVLASAIFKSYPTAGLVGVLMVGAPGADSNMDMYYSDVSFDPSRFASKVAYNAVDALMPSGVSDALIYLPCMALFIAGLVVAFKRRETWLISLFVVAGLVWLATCIIFQPQARYAFMLAPLGSATFPALFDGVTTNFRGRVARLALKVAVPGAVIASLVLAFTYRTGAEADRRTVPELAATAMLQPRGSVMSTSGSAVDIPLAYAVAPRPMLSVDPQINSPEEVAAWMTSLDVRVVFGFAADGPFMQRLARALGDGVTLRLIGESSSPAGRVSVWGVRGIK